MIAVDRSRVPRPAVLDPGDPQSAGARETARMIAHALDPGANAKPTPSAYSDDAVKLGLIRLFRGKCAYCETPINAASARDIEHFRPKGRIDPGGGLPPLPQGYYWLAADWDNLILSCPGCNQRRRQLVRNGDGEFEFAEESTGKLDQFPLRDEAGRVLSHDGDVADEEEHRLLLNPCIDDPRRHLRFDTEGNVIPRQLQGEVSDRGMVSIEVFELKRVVLVEARKARYLDLVSAWDDIDMLGQMVDGLGADHRDLIAQNLRRKRAQVEGMLADDQPYAGSMRWLSRPVIKRLEEVEQAFRNRFGDGV